MNKGILEKMREGHLMPDYILQVFVNGILNGVLFRLLILFWACVTRGRLRRGQHQSYARRGGSRTFEFPTRKPASRVARLYECSDRLKGHAASSPLVTTEIKASPLT